MKEGKKITVNGKDLWVFDSHTEHYKDDACIIYYNPEELMDDTSHENFIKIEISEFTSIQHVRRKAREAINEYLDKESNE